jgi:type II secretory pathway component PulF
MVCQMVAVGEHTGGLDNMLKLSTKMRWMTP